MAAPPTDYKITAIIAFTFMASIGLHAWRTLSDTHSLAKAFRAVVVNPLVMT